MGSRKIIDSNMQKGKKNMDQLKHPNSRKTNSLIKKMKRNEKKEVKKLGTHIKQNLIGEKLLWFKERIPENCAVLSKEQTLELMESYLARFDAEVEQIELKNSVGIRKNRQHVSRLDVINMTKERELQDFNSCGLEMPDLLDATQIQVLKGWNGELRYLSHFKLRRITKNHLVSS